MDLSVGDFMNPKAIETYLNQAASSAGINNISVSLSSKAGAMRGRRHRNPGSRCDFRSRA
jgi:hypothetical protein